MSRLGATGQGLSRRQALSRAGRTAVVISIGAALAACRGGVTTNTGGGTSASDTRIAIGTSVPAGSSTSSRQTRGGALTVATVRDIDSLDPLRYFTSVAGIAIRNLTDTLVRFNHALDAIPSLAQSWETPGDGSVYIFRLRPGVTFTDGTPFDADAVRLNIERFVQDTASPWHSDVADVQSVTAVDPLTVRVATARPFAPFLSKLPLGAGMMISPTAVQRLGDRLGREFTGAGCGPWKLTEWRPDDRFVAGRNEAYWDQDGDGAQLPYLDRVIFRPFPNEDDRLTYLKTGEVDAVASYLGGLPGKDVAAFKRESQFEYEEEPGLGWTGIDLNTSRPPFDRREVRQALALALDRAQIVETVLFGVGTPDDALLASIQPGSDPAFHPYLRPDTGRARALLQAAGSPRVSFTYRTAPSPANVQRAELIQDMIRAAGFEMKIEQIEVAALSERVRVGDYEAASTTWSGFIDPDGNLYQLFHSSRVGASNTTRYRSLELDALLERGRQVMDMRARIPIYQQAVRLLAEDSPAIVLYHPVNNTAVRRGVRDFPLGTAAIIRLANVWRS